MSDENVEAVRAGAPHSASISRGPRVRRVRLVGRSEKPYPAWPSRFRRLLAQNLDHRSLGSATVELGVEDRTRERRNPARRAKSARLRHAAPHSAPH
jgi:hypothetical protein